MKFWTFLLTLLVTSGLLMAQEPQEEPPSLDETLQQLSQDAAQSYLDPIASAFGANLNSGWFHRAPKAKTLGLDLEVGLVAMGTLFDDSHTHFETTGQFHFSEQQAQILVADLDLEEDVQQALIDQIISQDYHVGISGATIIGSSDDSLIVSFAGQPITFTSPNTGNDTTVVVGSHDVTLPIAGFGDLAEIKALPLLTPQFSIGTIMGTEFTIRYLPATKLSNDLGEFKYLGMGFQHNPGVWLPFPLPVELSLNYYTQKLTIGDLFESTASAYGFTVSKELGAVGLNITPYFGYLWETSEMTVTYDYVIDTPAGPTSQHVKFTMEGANKKRMVVGLSLRLLLININADYNFGDYKSLSAGVSLRF